MNREAIWFELGGSGNPTTLQLFRPIAALSLPCWLDVLREASADPDATARQRIRITRILVDLLRMEGE
jgi:hypothetical protein